MLLHVLTQKEVSSVDTESGPPLGRQHIFSRTRLQFLASLLISMGLGWAILKELGTWAAAAAWLLMGIGAISKIILSTLSPDYKRDT